MTAPIRLAAGPHVVRVTKDGFVAFEKSSDVPGGKDVVDAEWRKRSTKGHRLVHEKSGQAVRVIVDGNDVGAAPWTGDLDPGPHDVAARSSSSAAPSQRVDVQQGAKLDIELVAVKAAARLEVRTSDGKGNIYVDGKLVGEGTFVGDVGVGPHDIEVTREGFDSFEKSVMLADQQVDSETVTLRQPGRRHRRAQAARRTLFQGIYGGFGVLGVAGIGGMGTELDTHCSALGASQCDTPSPFGGGAFGYVGYTFDPVGFELMLGGLFDANGAARDVRRQHARRREPAARDAAAQRAFKIFRFGGMGALRVRATAQGQLIRASIAAGLGLSYSTCSPSEKRSPPTAPGCKTSMSSTASATSRRPSARTARFTFASARAPRFPRPDAVGGERRQQRGDRRRQQRFLGGRTLRPHQSRRPRTTSRARRRCSLARTSGCSSVPEATPRYLQICVAVTGMFGAGWLIASANVRGVRQHRAKRCTTRRRCGHGPRRCSSHRRCSARPRCTPR